jgi:hypothetical protein
MFLTIKPLPHGHERRGIIIFTRDCQLELINAIYKNPVQYII